MRLVVDTNILVSFFRKNPVSEIISESKFSNLQLFATKYSIEELKNNEKDILKYSGFNTKQFKEKLLELSKLIKFFSEDLYREFEQEAKQLIHDKDVPIFALALKLRCPIWSNEPSFKQQSKVPVLSTRDLIELFS